MNKTIVVFASSRSFGNTRKLVDSLASKINLDVLDISNKNVAPYDYEYKNQGDDFLPTLRQIIKYENIIFATPIYWNTPCAQMKTFIDRNYDFLDQDELKEIRKEIIGKSGFVACTSSSKQATSAFMEAFKITIEFMGLDYGGYIHANCENEYDAELISEEIADFSKLVNN